MVALGLGLFVTGGKPSLCSHQDVYWLLCNGIESLTWRQFYSATGVALKCLGKPTSLSTSKLLKLEKRSSDKGARNEWKREAQEDQGCSEGHCCSNRCLLIIS